MKKIILLLISILVCMSGFTQDPAKKHHTDLGIVFSGLNQFGLRVKTGTDKFSWRFNTLYVRGNFDQQKVAFLKPMDLGILVKGGIQSSKKILSNFRFIFGSELNFQYSNGKSEHNPDPPNEGYYSYEIKYYSYGINVVLGFYYNFSEKFNAGVEMTPYFNLFTMDRKYVYQIDRNISEYKSNNTGKSFGLQTQHVYMTINYRF